MNTNGTCIATAGKDRCIRLLVRTEEIVFPNEEQDRIAQETLDEAEAARSAKQRIPQLEEGEVGVGGQRTAETTTAAERIMDALDLVDVELQRQRLEPEAQPSPLLMKRNVWEYLWSTLDKVRPSEMRHAITCLTSLHLEVLMKYLDTMLQEGAVLNFETAANVLLAMATPAPGTTNGRSLITVSRPLDAALLLRVKGNIVTGLREHADRISYTQAGASVIMRYLESKERLRFFDVSKIQGHRRKYHSATR